MMNDPLAYFLTITTYGTWLPGDKRGWVEYHHGWRMPDLSLAQEANALMKEDACLLSAEQRLTVEHQVAETCEHRGWMMHAVNCRSNHMHAAITAVATHPKKIQKDIKSWCTRRLKTEYDPTRENWWTERGSVRFVWDEESLERVIAYVNEAQDRKHLP